MNEDHLRRLLREYTAYYNTERVHASITTRIDRPGVPVIMALDPDGVRVELVQRPGPVDAFPGGEGYEMKR